MAMGRVGPAAEDIELELGILEARLDRLLILLDFLAREGAPGKGQARDEAECDFFH
jgi:hypothetical protein